MDARVHQVIELMGDNLHRKLSLREMAQAVSLSTSRLCHLFKAETGRSPAHYLKLRRFEKARQFLGTSTLALKEIAYLIGSPDPSHFVKDFKRLYSLTPRQYRTRYYCAPLAEKNQQSDDAGAA